MKTSIEKKDVISVSAFSRIELCTVVSVLVLMVLMAVTALARSYEPGKRMECANNLRRLGVATLVHSSENDGLFPPRFTPYWMTRLQPYYRDTAVLTCPEDPSAARVIAPGTPAETNLFYAPRSYLMNGFDDYFWITLVDANGFPDSRWDAFVSHRYPFGIPETAIPKPSDTILFGEKVSDSSHVFVDILQGFGDDWIEVEHGRHFRSSPTDTRASGSNYAMADGSLRFLRYGKELAPLNLWGVTDLWRTNTMSPF